MPQTSGLTVRQHEREGIQLPVEFVVSDLHSSQVRFSPSSGAAGAATLRGEAIDISSGGLGFRCRQFVPRMCEGLVRVFTPIPGKVDRDGAPVLEKVLEQRVKVRRVTLIGREPLYSLGVAFIDPDPELDGKISALFKRIQALGMTLPSASGGGRHA